MNAGVIGYAAGLIADAAQKLGWTIEQHETGAFPWGRAVAASGVLDPSMIAYATPYAVQILEIRALPEAVR